MTASGALLVALLFQSPTGPTGAAPAAVPAPAPAAVPTKARLELRGGTECISRSAVAAAVAARSARIQFVDDASTSVTVAVTASRRGPVTVELVLGTPGSDPAPRRIVARSCAEAADAVAVIIVVALDPTLKRKPAPGEEGTSGAGISKAEGGIGGTTASPAAGVTSTGQPTEQPTSTDRATDRTPATKAPPPPTLEAAGPAGPPVPVPSAPTRRQFGAYLAGQTIFGPSPSLMPGIAFFGMAGLDRDGVWAPALFLGVMHVGRSGLAQPGGAASFALDAASVDACPLRVGGPHFVARPCASVLIGRLAATGTETEQGQSVPRPFAVAGLALSASLGTTIEVWGRLGVGLTLIRDSYEFGTVTFHRAAAVTTSASLGIGRRWP